MRAAWILIDEFASVLDRMTAMSLGAAVRRAADRLRVRVVCASAHDDVLGSLKPTIACWCELDGSWSLDASGAHIRPGLALTIEPGTAEDMDRLLPYHYRAGKPATRVGVIRAVDRTHQICAGVLVVSMPTLNGAWREQAWPGRFAGSDRKAAADRINAELRCISRVIVDPRYRGLGLATRLVRAYLDRPLSTATEAVAALGAICPFFERAGMEAYRVPMNAADARLADAIEAAGFEPWMLADTRRAEVMCDDVLIATELERWAKSRRVEMSGVKRLSRFAAARLCVEPMAYAAVSPPECVASAATRNQWGDGDAKRRRRAGRGCSS
jgi:GNAT superfamily N-acetyltransferase